jgi:hypothetical protein
MTIVNIALQANTAVAVPSNWNRVLGPTATGEKLSSLIDSSEQVTGLSFWVTNAFTAAIASTSLANADAQGVPKIVWQHCWYASSNGAAEIRGFQPGQVGVLRVAGDGGNADRDSDYIVNGGAPVRYDANGGEPFTAAAEIPFVADGAGVVSFSGAVVNAFWYAQFLIVEYTEASAPSIPEADDIADESQPATFTLSGNENAPTGITINGEAGSNITFVSEDTGAGTETYSYEPPLIADDDTADLVVSVDGTTASATIAYANSYDRGQLTHPTTEAEYSENSLSYPNAYATNQPYEWKVIADANAAVVTIDWNALEADDGFHKDVASYATPVANGSTTVTLGVFVPETGQAYQFDRTITVSDGSVVVEGEGLFRSLFSALEKSLFKPLFR